jgi:electron transfer flavoprotein beta subunit
VDLIQGGKLKIYVCVKHVPDTAATIKLTDERSFDDSVKFVMNPHDETALEQALQLRDQVGDDSEVVVITMGNDAAKTTLRHALAMGGNRALHVKSDEQLPDQFVIASVLAKAIADDGEADIIFTGMLSVDSEGMQTPYRLAAKLSMPVATGINNFAYADGTATVKREVEGGGIEVFKMKLPCVAACSFGLNQPRYPKMPDIIKAKKKEIKEIELASLGLGELKPKTERLKMEMPAEKAPAKILEGSVEETSKELLRLLKEEANVL